MELLTGALVASAVLVPGLLCTWGYEQELGSNHAGVGDRLQRLLAISLVLASVALAIAITAGGSVDTVTNSLEGGPVRLLVWVPLGVLAGAYGIGRGVGWLARRRHRGARLFHGPQPAPTAWDYLFQDPERMGWVRIWMKDGSVLGGAWGGSSGTASYASGYPEPSSIFLGQRVALDEGGDFLRDDNEEPIDLGGGVLVSATEIQFVEFIPVQEVA